MNHLIDEQAQLKELEPILNSLCSDGGVVAVDTEFLREKTYNAKLCLVQLGIGEHQYCIDVLKIEDLSVLVKLFESESVIKLFHAARQDMEVILQTFGVLPTPIFDTQLAAAFCGADIQIGYGALVQDLTGVELPKSQSRTDWTRRPLSQEQIEYAGEDVAYLEQMYEVCLERLHKNQRWEWYQQEIGSYYDESLYIINPEKAYQRLSGGMLKIKHQYLLKALANWREATAQERNIPRSWVIRDEKLYELAQSSVNSEQEILELGVFGRKSASYLAPEAFKLMKSVEVGKERLWRKIEPLTKPEKAVCSSMMKKLTELSKQNELPQALLATRKDIESLYRNRTSKKLMNGWREAIVGQPILTYLRATEAQA